jgi:glycosyltransferase involved in cell wall biosynthesis
MLLLQRKGPAPLEHGGEVPGGRLSVAAIVPSFRRGSGGHATIVHLLKELRERGHETSLWLEDHEGRHVRERPELTKRSFDEFFCTEGLPLHTDFASWKGADVALATGWQTVARTQLLRGLRARAYLVQDHETDFYAASAESLWAQETYRQGLHCIAASPWLADLLRSRYGASASHFDLALDHTIYHPTAERRRDDLVVFYARAITPRRAVPLGMLALTELSRRRPEIEIALFGEDLPLRVPFPHRNRGLLGGPALASLYSRATVGMVLSLTNPSLIALEMMACGLPCVELASESMLATYARDGPPDLTAPEPLALCAAIERLLDDPARRSTVSQAGVQLVAQRTWERAADQVQEGLRVALASAAV